MNGKTIYLTAVTALSLLLPASQAQNLSLTVDAGQAVGTVSPRFFGLMTEEINHSYDGGLYAELIQNRSLMDNATKAIHWSLVQRQAAKAEMSLDDSTPLNEVLTNSLRLDITTASEAGPAGVANDGYWGIPITPNTTYRASFYARSDNHSGPLIAKLESADGSTTFAETKLSGVGVAWKEFGLNLRTGALNPTKGRFVIYATRRGSLWLTLVSLFPPTFNNRPNGTRPDIMRMLADLKPSFLRFPGGNYVEGDTVETRFDWKKTIGPLTSRPGHQCPWGYRSTDGFGLLEFLQWCEDLHMEPVLAVYAGYNLDHSHIEPGAALQPYVQDALDEIEYTCGDASTTWGGRRAQDGHPAPFPLHYVEIGNEDWFDKSGSYDARFAQFFDAIKAKYPKLECISTVGTEHPENQRVHSRKPDVIDEHYYSSAATFDSDSPTHFENYDHNGPKIFVGEWAAYEDVVPWEPPSRKLPPTPSLKSALADACWMAGMERHSDLIVMQCYAPMFVNVNPGARQWRPNLIGYDGFNCFGSPSYYAIQMFSQNHGDTILKTTASPGLNQSATRDSATGLIYVQLINPKGQPAPVDITLQNVTLLAPTATAITLSAPDETASNSVDKPAAVVPVTTTVPNIQPSFTYSMAPYSVTVLQLKPR